MSDRSELRQEALERAGHRCEWPHCVGPQDWIEMAHLEPRGMGGRRSVDRLENVMMLCKYHHDLLDGRTHAGLKRELLILLKSYREKGGRS